MVKAFSPEQRSAAKTTPCEPQPGYDTKALWMDVVRRMNGVDMDAVCKIKGVDMLSHAVAMVFCCALVNRKRTCY